MDHLQRRSKTSDGPEDQSQVSCERVYQCQDGCVKDEIEEIANAVEKIKQIRGVTFVRNDSESKERRAGVIAQEVEKVLPEVITKKEDGTFDYTDEFKAEHTGDLE